jgi:hypothetical protein
MAARTTTTKTAAPKAAPRRKPLPEPEPPEPAETPLVVFAARPPAGPVKRVFVFESGGRKFYAPATPPTGILMRYLRKLSTNEESAYLYLIEAMCGVEAYDALADDPGTTVDDIAAVVNALRQLLKGSPEDPKA